LIAWHVLNKQANPQDKRFGDSFLIVTPGITIKDRLRVLMPRASIDESAWSELYKTTSRPFDPPSSGKIAVKVINHYGDEVLKLFEMARYEAAKPGISKAADKRRSP